MKSLTHEDLENQVKEKLKHVSALTPQEQAEAMALAFKLRDFLPEHVIEYMSTEEEDAFVASISTALSKLIAENERLKNGTISGSVGQSTRQLVAQLTATEAKLEAAIELLRKVADADDQCDCYQSMMNGKHYEDCPTELARQSKAFLSTLTAEKKEEG